MKMNYLIRIAMKENRNRTDKFRHWCFILDSRKNLIEWSTNSEFHAGPIIGRLGYRENRHSLHAEVAAFRKASGLLDLRRDGAFVAVNIRLNTSNELRNSKPCRRCQAFLESMGVREIWYTTPEGIHRV